MSQIIDALKLNKRLDDDQLRQLLTTDIYDEELFASALEIREKYYGRKVFIRGLIEVSNFCKNDCYYCGIRRSNKLAERFRLTDDEILECCDYGYDQGFRTFVLQGGEDNHFGEERVRRILDAIKSKYPDCAITLSLGEQSEETYRKWFDAGADRYLLRHETANEIHYGRLHPQEMSLKIRQECLRNLKKIGYAVGSGIMVGSPYQSIDTIIEDVHFLQELNPDMIGIGPYMRHKDTPFRDYPNGDMKLTLRLLGLFRHMFPTVLMPSTTALGTIDPKGRELGILAGANVVMPNLSPKSARQRYRLYDNIICEGDESAEGLEGLKRRLADIGFDIAIDRGDKAQG